jgi:hypothetical protein
MTLVAPGGVQMGEAAQGTTGKHGGKAAGKPDKKEKAIAPATPPAAPKQALSTAPPAKPAGSGTTASAGKISAPASSSSRQGTAVTAHTAEPAPDPLPDKPEGAAAAHAGPPNRTDAAGRVWDPNLSRTAPPTQQAARAAQPKPPVVPGAAERLDLPLTFTATPVGEVYDRLATAHGVRFRIDPGVDRSFPITANLQGRRLEDALALVAGQARHRVRRIADGSYTVVAVGSDRALADAPVAETPLEDAP